MTGPVLAPDLGREDWRRDALIAAVFGSIPIIGVLAWGWSPFALMLLFWFENAVIGVRQVVMMWLVARARLDEAGAAIFQSGFFALHYGGFALAHGFFTVLFFFVMGPHAPPADPDGGIPVDLDIAFAEAWRLALTVPLGFAAIFGWQAVQLAQFVAREEAKTVTLRALMGEPYLRVVVLHLVLIIVGGAIMGRELAPQALVVLAVYKVAFDVGELWWRNRKTPPAKTWRDLPAPTSGVIFDAAKADFYAHPFFMVAGVFLFIGVLMLLGEETRGLGILWTGFVGLITGLGLFSLRTNRRKLIDAIKAERVTEGRIEQLFVSPERGAESFICNGVGFTYSDNAITGGFNKTTLKKGPIREGLLVRIHYTQLPNAGPTPLNVIARLEILEP